MENKLKFMTSMEKDAVARFVEFLKMALGESLIKVEVFGSKVRGDYTGTSDIDILIIVTERTMDRMDTIAGITAEINLEYDVSVAPVVFSDREYKTNLKMGAPFPLAVEADGVVL